jgi:membrane protein implicated in regulation of membrane protease activity
MRLPERDDRPSALLWLTAVAGMLLPVVGVATALYGIFKGAGGDRAGWYWAGAGVALVVADIVIDAVWGNPMVLRSDEPDLNRRGTELIGQIVVVVERIEAGGRATVRAADSIWVAEGCRAAAGARVRVTDVKGTVLAVTPL